MGRGIPLAENGFREPQGWLRDVLGGKADGVPGSCNQVRFAVYKVVAEPTGKGGPVSPPKATGVALGGS